MRGDERGTVSDSSVMPASGQKQSIVHMPPVLITDSDLEIFGLHKNHLPRLRYHCYALNHIIQARAVEFSFKSNWPQGY